MDSPDALTCQIVNTVYVHAWEYVYQRANGRGDGGSDIGFNWWANEAEARAAFTDGRCALSPSTMDPDAHADFFFPFHTTLNPIGPIEERRRISAKIELNLLNLIRQTMDRRVGTKVLRYWNSNNIRRGGRTGRAKQKPNNQPTGVANA